MCGKYKKDVCKIKKARFIKKQKVKGLLSNLGIRTLLSKIPILRDVLFDCNFIECSSIENFKTNNIINTFLLAGDKCMPEIHLI